MACGVFVPRGANVVYCFLRHYGPLLFVACLDLVLSTAMAPVLLFLMSCVFLRLVVWLIWIFDSPAVLAFHVEHVAYILSPVDVMPCRMERNVSRCCVKGAESHIEIRIAGSDSSLRCITLIFSSYLRCIVRRLMFVLRLSATTVWKEFRFERVPACELSARIMLRCGIMSSN